MNIDPNLAAVMAHLAELAIPSATATIYTKVEAITKGKATEQTVNELKQIINDLIKERNDLVAIAQTYEQELVAQRISDQDIKYGHSRDTGKSGHTSSIFGGVEEPLAGNTCVRPGSHHFAW